MRSRRMAVLLAAASLALAACSDDEPAPRVDPGPTTSPSESSSSPTMPVSEPPRPTAIDVVRGWVEERNRALSSGQTMDLRELTADSCASCEPYIDLIEDVYAAGGSYDTEGWTVNKASELKPMEVAAAITMSGGTMSAAAGKPPDEYAEDKAIFRFRVKSVGDEVVVSYMALIR